MLQCATIDHGHGHDNLRLPVHIYIQDKNISTSRNYARTFIVSFPISLLDPLALLFTLVSCFFAPTQLQCSAHRSTFNTQLPCIIIGWHTQPFKQARNQNNWSSSFLWAAGAYLTGFTSNRVGNYQSGTAWLQRPIHLWVSRHGTIERNKYMCYNII